MNDAAPLLHAKQVELELVWHSVGKFFKVTKITNSSWRLPGETVQPDMVKLINESGKYPNWKVSAVDYDYFAAIASLVGAGASMIANKGLL
jgi:hypothetical protein